MRETGATDELLSRLNNEGIDTEVFDRVEPNPSYTTVDEGAELAKKCDMVIGLGGGSAMDAAKAIAIAAFEQKPISSFFSGETPSEAMPVIEIPTTAGTGSEADTKTDFKFFLRRNTVGGDARNRDSDNGRYRK